VTADEAAGGALAAPAGHRTTGTGFSFSAVVGMDDLRLALVLNAVSPAIGGVLVRGEKGTAKSTMVRALAAVLPEVAAVAGCRFSCDPAAPEPGCPDGPHERHAPAVTRPARLVELPVGASEDRLAGALDLERALTEGVKAYEPGLLAAAHRGVLYVDEVNLLHDHLVDLLLDAAALGTSYVERDGVSVRHPARFLLVGTMNPEEGELRPQLLDRFGLAVEAAAPREPGARAEVIRRRLAYDTDPAGFTAAWADAETALARRILAARQRLARVVLPDAALRQVASVCAAFGVDGLRADLVTARAAMAHAAWEGRPEVSAADIRAAARLALPHRRRRQPFDSPGFPEDELDRAIAEAAGDGGGSPDDDGPGDDGPGDDGPGGGSPGRGGDTTGSTWAPDVPQPERPDRDQPSPERSGAGTAHAGTSGPGLQRRGAAQGQGQSGIAPAGPAGTGEGAGDAPAAAPGALFRVRRLDVPGRGTGAPGRRSPARASTGRVIGARVPQGRLTRVHLAATVAAAAPHQLTRGRIAPRPLRLSRDDLREAHLEGREGNLVLFVVDASGSMAARSRMGAVKGAILSLLIDAYQRRDKVGLVTFRGISAEVLLPPTSSVTAAAARLAALPTGGRTPVAAGLLRAHELLRTERLRDPRRRPLLVLVTDGRATGGPDPVGAAHRAAALLAASRVTSVVVDCEAGPLRLGLAAALAATLQCAVLRPAELAAGPLAESVRAFSAPPAGRPAPTPPQEVA
jgi:magnesium chelatase subunit D